MDSPTSRVLALLELLQGQAELNGTELASRLGVDGRTLRRYIARLQALGVPVQAGRGRYGAYRLRPGARLPPLIFNEQEALAASIGLQFAAHAGLDDAMAGARSAQGKLERVMPEALAARLRALSQTLQLDISAPSAAMSGSALLELGLSAHLRQRVSMHYTAVDGAHTERAFDCFGLAWRGGNWYAVGHCHLRASLRSFRVDRIRSVTPLGQNFVLPVDFDAVRHLALGLARIPRTHPLLVRLHTDIDTARRELFDAIGLLTPAPDHVLLHGQADDLSWYARQLARLPFDFQVVEPPLLQEALHALAARLNRLAGATDGARGA